MPTWTTPKTNWVGTDYFYATDWLRIVGNLEKRGIKVWFNVGFGNKLYMTSCGDTFTVGLL